MALCPAMAAVVKLDDASEGVVDDHYLAISDGDPSTELPLDHIWDMISDYNDAMDTLAQAVPADYVDDVRALRELNDTLLAAGVLETSAADEFEAAMSSVDTRLLEEAGRGVLRLDGLARSECDLVLAD